MKALILVGGYGTRMRPLTLTVPKPLIDFCDKPIVEHQIAALVEAGVTHVILAVGHDPAPMKAASETIAKKYKIRVSFSEEKDPLGTAGPIRLAADLLRDGAENEESFFVFNSDIICDFPLSKLKEFHKNSGGEGTVLSTKVPNPEAFGVIVADSDGLIDRFVEKPAKFVGDQVNAGLYLLNKSIIGRINERPTSIEREIFPSMAQDKVLYTMNMNSFWADLGKPVDYLSGMRHYLGHLARTANKEGPPSYLANGSHISGDVMISPTATVGAGCLLGPNVSIGEGCVIEDGVRLVDCAVLSGVTVRKSAYISNSIIGWRSTIGAWVRIEGLSVFGENVTIADTCLINRAFVLPHKGVAESITEAGSIVM